MHKFEYKAFNDKLDIITGEIEEKDIKIAKQKLKMQGLTIVDLKKKIEIKNLMIFKKNLGNEQLSIFCGQMSIIMESGLNLIDGIEMIKNQNKALKVPMGKILNNLKKGETLGFSVEDSGDFPNLLSDMIKIGELSGTVDEVFSNMEEYYERESILEKKIKNASIYPSIIICVVIGMIIFFNYFVFQNLQGIYENTEQLPYITKIFLNMMNFIKNNIKQIGISIFVFAIMMKYIKKVKFIQRIMDLTIIKLPILGILNKDIITSRFTRSLYIFIKSAVPIVFSIENIVKIVGNSYISEKINNAKQEIVTGVSISEALGKREIFDSLVIEMIRVGEETGKLEKMLDKLSFIYNKRVENNLNKVIALVEPVFTLVIGLLVGFVVIAIALPILKMSNNIK